MTDEEKHELSLILDFFLIHRGKTGETIVGGRAGELESELRKFIARVKGEK